MLPNYCNVSSQRNNIIKLTHFDETKKRAHRSDGQSYKENLKLNYGGPSQRLPWNIILHMFEEINDNIQFDIY